MLKRQVLIKVAVVAVLVAVLQLMDTSVVVAQVTNPQQGSVGIAGTIPSEPPKSAPTISVPSNGQTFSKLPVTVSGICTANLEVRLFRNGVFAGSAFCEASGSYTMQIDLFSGNNTLIARVYDALGQASPDSNKVNLTYSIPSEDDGVEQLVITTNFSVRGANPSEELTWPIAISGGKGPYAFSVDWGDGFVEPISAELAGQIILKHSYTQPGVYKLIVKATDSRGKSAFLQLIAVANGPVSDNAGSETEAEGGTTGVDNNKPKIILWPIYLMFFFVFSTFWIGRRYERRYIKQKLYNRENIKF